MRVELKHAIKSSLTSRILPYTEVSSYSSYSFLNGGSSPESLVRRAVELGLSGLAITDHVGVYGLPKAYQVARDHPGFKLITGADISLGGDPWFSSIQVIAPTIRAYAGMCRVLTEWHSKHAQQSVAILSDWDRWCDDIPEFKSCLFFPQWESSPLQGRFQKKSPLWERLMSFKENLYWPISQVKDGFCANKLDWTQAVVRRFGVKAIAHQGVRYATLQDAESHRIKQTIATLKPYSEAWQELVWNRERRIKSPEEMARVFQNYPQLLQTTQEVGERCSFSMGDLRLQYPTEQVPEGMTSHEFLKKICYDRLPQRYPLGVPEKVRHVLQKELELVRTLNFEDYFLTVFDLVEFSKSQGILCQGRGSAANSVICYLLGVTAIDPVRMELLFERFLSVERGEPPDIDIDFEHERREEVIQYLYQRYGRDRAAMVAAVHTFQRKGARRDGLRLQGIRDFDGKQQPHSDLPPLVMGHPRQLGLHCGGFVLSQTPLHQVVPIQPAAMPGRTMIQWDKYDLDILGFSKVDVLALGMLSALSRCLNDLGLRWDQVPAEDSATYAMIQRADTIGVFQIESRAQMSMLPRLRPQNFYDLVIEVALVRPGPIVGKMVHPYLRRRQGLEPVDLPHPKLASILGRTLGVPIFQEQVMKMAIELAGFSPGESDQLRRAIGAWRSQGSLDVMGKRLAEGLRRAGISQEFCDRVFDQIKGFSEYGFPESHAASFALITYVSCYFKRHYPAVFLKALLNSQPLGFYTPHSLIEDAKRHDVRVLSVCILRSLAEVIFSPEDSRGVRLGFNQIQGLRAHVVKDWLEYRTQHPVLSCIRWEHSVLKPHEDVDRILAAVFSFPGFHLGEWAKLALSGAFEGLGLNSRESLSQILLLWQSSPQAQQMVLFKEAQGLLFERQQLKPMQDFDQVVADFKAMRLSVRGHPMLWVRERLQGQGVSGAKRSFLTHQQIKNLSHGTRVRFVGLSIVLQRPPTANGTAFATLEDETGILDLVFFKKVFEASREILKTTPFLWIDGKVQRSFEAVHVQVYSVKTLFHEQSDGDHPMPQIAVTPGSYARWW